MNQDSLSRAEQTRQKEIALCLAAQQNDTESAASLIQTGSVTDVNCRNDSNESPLFLAAFHNNLTMVLLLLRQSAESIHIQQHDNRIIKGLYLDLSNGSKGETALMIACKKGHLEIVNILLGAGADANYSIYHHESRTEENALSYAISSCYAEIVKSLLSKGAGVNQPYLQGDTPLIQAIKKGNVAVVQLLLAQGAHVEKIDSTAPLSTAPLWCAVSCGNTEIVKLLLAHGAQVDNAGLTTLTLLDYAKAYRPSMVTLLSGQDNNVAYKP